MVCGVYIAPHPPILIDENATHSVLLVPKNVAASLMRTGMSMKCAAEHMKEIKAIDGYQLGTNAHVMRS